MAFNYELQSCDILSYPNITNLCWDSPHPMSGLWVNIEGCRSGAVDASRTYQLVFIGEDVAICNAFVPCLSPATEQTCSPSYGVFAFRDCATRQIINIGFPNGDPAFNVIREDGQNECYQFIGEAQPAQLIFLNPLGFNDCTECLQALQDTTCEIGERTISYAVRVKLPEPPPPDRGFKECCYQNKVFASLTDIKSYYNDFNGFYFKRQTPDDSVVFKLVDVNNAIEYTLNDSTYGEFLDFDEDAQPDLSFYIVEWRNVLNLLGEGTYQIKQEVTIAGINIDLYSNTFQLCKFSFKDADLTVRLDCVQNGLLVNEGVNFKGTNFRTSQRVRGYFGDTNRSYEKDMLTTRDYDSIQVSASFEREYKYQGLSLPECIATDIAEFIVLGNEVYVSDYNLKNHSYKYDRLPIEISNNEGEGYNIFVRGANLNLTFIDRFRNNRKLNC